MSADGRFANCECTVQTGRYYVLMTGILNYQVYQDTVNVCGADGSACAGQPDKAPVCNAIRQGKFIPGANVISAFDQSHQSNLVKLRKDAASPSSLTICPKAPYAGCMTAPCWTTTPGHAQCSCPIFWGIFQLSQANATCSLGRDLVWSASYDPTFDVLH